MSDRTSGDAAPERIFARTDLAYEEARDPGENCQHCLDATAKALYLTLQDAQRELDQLRPALRVNRDWIKWAGAEMDRMRAAGVPVTRVVTNAFVPAGGIDTASLPDGFFVPDPPGVKVSVTYSTQEMRERDETGPFPSVYNVDVPEGQWAVEVRGGGEADYKTLFVSGVQSFTIAEYPVDGDDDARESCEWFAAQFRKAMQNLGAPPERTPQQTPKNLDGTVIGTLAGPCVFVPVAEYEALKGRKVAEESDCRKWFQYLVDFVRADQCVPKPGEDRCLCCTDYLSVAEHAASKAGLADGWECYGCDGDGVVGRSLDRCTKCAGTGRLSRERTTPCTTDSTSGTRSAPSTSAPLPSGTPSASGSPSDSAPAPKRTPCGVCDGYTRADGTSWHRMGCPRVPDDAVSVSDREVCCGVAFERAPGRCGGAWVIEGTRMTVWAIDSMYRANMSPAEIQRRYPHLTIDQVEAAIALPTQLGARWVAREVEDESEEVIALRAVVTAANEFLMNASWRTVHCGYEAKQATVEPAYLDALHGVLSKAAAVMAKGGAA